eukprot:TRINITY_DN7809_c0_g1_i4.p1 TRINITY_DN7809_c0_g1~~TRINITY_DN7809_c0_g1_i4.p1  ORF type:complete len:301 (-),score=19.94 TRINITY_DN7809_c0_g1_i4:1048-1950(-)
MKGGIFKGRAPIMGRKLIFYNHRLSLNRSIKGLMLTSISLVVSAFAFFITTLIEIEYPHNIFFVVWLSLLLFLSIYYIFMLALTEPGVSPPAFGDHRGITDTHTDLYKGRLYPLKYCPACMIYRPLRTHHCRECDLCIMELDHHCPWISNCIGKRNRRMFLQLLLTLFVYFSSICAITIYYLQKKHAFELLKYIGLTWGIGWNIVLATLSFGFGIYVLLLMLYQLFLIGKGLTTYEFAKKVYKNQPNPFDEGVLRNFGYFLRRDVSESLIHSIAGDEDGTAPTNGLIDSQTMVIELKSSG